MKEGIVTFQLTAEQRHIVTALRGRCPPVFIFMDIWGLREERSTSPVALRRSAILASCPTVKTTRGCQKRIP